MGEKEVQKVAGMREMQTCSCDKEQREKRGGITSKTKEEKINQTGMGLEWRWRKGERMGRFWFLIANDVGGQRSKKGTKM